MLLLDAKKVLVLYTNKVGQVCVKMYPETDEVRSYYSPVNIKLGKDMIFRVTSRTPDGNPEHYELFTDWLYSSLRIYNPAYLDKQFDEAFMSTKDRTRIANRSNWAARH